MASTVKVTVRPAERKDCDAIMILKKELAAHQNMQDRPILLTSKDLERDGFDISPPRFHCLVAETGTGEVVGYALYFYAFAVWEGKVIHLEDICTSSQLRGQGIGKDLMIALANIALEGKFSRIQLEVLDWNQAAIKFYEKLGGINFTKKEGWQDFEFDIKRLQMLSQE